VYTESLPGEANAAPEPNLPAIRAEIDWTQVWTVTEEIADLGVEAVAGLPSDAPRKSRQGRSACRLRKHMNIESPQSESGDWSAKRHRTTLIEDDVDARDRDAENSEMVRRITSEKPQIARGRAVERRRRRRTNVGSL
jgi:hypothetical protein